MAILGFAFLASIALASTTDGAHTVHMNNTSKTLAHCLRGLAKSCKTCLIVSPYPLKGRKGLILDIFNLVL
jgi:hypothetical protein